MYLKIRGGVIDSTRISLRSDKFAANAERKRFDQVLKGKSIHEINDFNDVLNQTELNASTDVSSISRWLNTMFGKPGRTP